MNVKTRDIMPVLKQVFTEFSKHNCMQLAAALAYYSIFSLAPLLIIAISVVGLIWGAEAARGEIAGQISQIVGSDAAKTIEELLKTASKPSDNIWATVLGGATLLFGASGVFNQLKQSLNTIWNIPTRTGLGVMGFIKERVLCFAMVLGVGFLLLVSLVLTALLAAFEKVLEYYLPVPTQVVMGLAFALSFAVITLLFGMIYKVLPDAVIRWRQVWLGAAVTALLFTIGKTVLGYYLGRESVGSSYGAAGSFVVLLMWVYYSSVILFIGAEFTQVLAGKIGPSISARYQPVAK